MTVTAVRHKPVQLDRRRMNRTRRVLGTRKETLHHALDLVVTEADIDRALRAARGKSKLRRVF
jgi:hypothetical protein